MASDGVVHDDATSVCEPPPAEICFAGPNVGDGYELLRNSHDSVTYDLSGRVRAQSKIGTPCPDGETRRSTGIPYGGGDLGFGRFATIVAPSSK